MKRRAWTAREVEIMKSLYPSEPSEVVAKEIGRTTKAVHLMAHALGLRKTADFFASTKSGRINRGTTDPRIKGTHFQKGATPWNKGIPRSTGIHPNCQATQFKRGDRTGAAQHNYVPLGTLKIRDGLLAQKVSDDPGLYSAQRWTPVHRLVWERANGPVPAGRVVVFRLGMKTLDLEEITLDRLELVTRSELMTRNSVHTNYPPELAQLVQLRGAINRQINKRNRALEQT